MRDDITQLLNNRPSWVLHNDNDYQNLLAALDYARKSNNKDAIEELELWLEQRRIILLGN